MYIYISYFCIFLLDLLGFSHNLPKLRHSRNLGVFFLVSSFRFAAGEKPTGKPCSYTHFDTLGKGALSAVGSLRAVDPWPCGTFDRLGELMVFCLDVFGFWSHEKRAPVTWLFFREV